MTPRFSGLLLFQCAITTESFSRKGAKTPSGVAELHCDLAFGLGAHFLSMDKNEIVAYLTRLDREISVPVVLYIYGSAVVILLDAPERTSLDIDVAGPYSSGNMAEIACASQRAGLPLNPDPLYQGNHLEWVGPLRLCLPPPQKDGKGLVLWQGEKVTVCSGCVEDLVASKLIRYDETDRADVQYLYAQFCFDWSSVREAVGRLPHPFKADPMVLDNLSNLNTDMLIWKGDV